MNTKGIGLGLVISKMITEEFGGEAKLHSKFEIGSIFQSSFKLRDKRQSVAARETNNSQILSI